MRNQFADSLLSIASHNPKVVFFTGDLGFNALEKLRDNLSERFINAGVAEQNMITVAAGLASKGFVSFVYSITPFVTYRPYEQIRNDVCLHNLPVKIVGNGGGYGYGIMGATHHAIEDIGSMRMLPNMKVFLPCIRSDVHDALHIMVEDPSPNYLRLNSAKDLPFKIPSFSQWRKISSGSKSLVITCGTIVNALYDACESLFFDLEVWVLSALPVTHLPEEIIDSLNSIGKIVILEEHTDQGGIGELLSKYLLAKVNKRVQFLHLYAQGYPSGKYGSQRWHQEESHIAGLPLQNELKSFLQL